MDALAGLAFGVTVVTAVKFLMGKKNANSIAFVTARAGLFSMGFEAIIYLALILLGAMSLGKFAVSANGGVAFDQIVNHYLGVVGQSILAALITLTCLTTAIGLVAAFAQDFHKHFPKISYKTWLAFTSAASFLTANLGFESNHCLVNTCFDVLVSLGHGFDLTFRLFTTFPSRFSCLQICCHFHRCSCFIRHDGCVSPVVSQSGLGKAMASFQQSYLPFAQYGMDWVVPALVGMVLGVGCYLVKRHVSLGKVPEQNQQ